MPRKTGVRCGWAVVVQMLVMSWSLVQVAAPAADQEAAATEPAAYERLFNQFKVANDYVPTKVLSASLDNV